MPTKINPIDWSVKTVTYAEHSNGTTDVNPQGIYKEIIDEVTKIEGTSNTATLNNIVVITLKLATNRLNENPDLTNQNDFAEKTQIEEIVKWSLQTLEIASIITHTTLKPNVATYAYNNIIESVKGNKNRFRVSDLSLIVSKTIRHAEGMIE